jgi:DNA polymerase-1
MVDNNLLFLIDAYYLIFRAYYTFIKYPKFNSLGFNTSVILGFVNSLINILNTFKPKYIVIVFDKTNNNSFRHHIYTEYKSNRIKTPELIKESIPYIYNILKYFNIRYVYYDNFEADDVIASLSNKFSYLDINIYIVTADKDLLQLVSKNIKICKPNKIGGFDVLGIKEVCEKYNITHPIQIIDLFAMSGDSSDNIPGIPGIGLKLAAKFISKYGNIEDIFKNINNFTEKQQFNIKKHKNLGVISKKLFTLKKDLFIDLELNNLIWMEPDYNNIKKIFDSLKFKNLLIRVNKFFKNYFNIHNNNFIHSRYITYSKVICQLIDLSISKYLFYKILLLQNTVSFYIDYFVINNIYYIKSISFTWNKYTSYYFFYNDSKNIQKIKTLLQELNIFFSNSHIMKVSYDIKLIIKILYFYGIVLKEPFYDIMIAHSLLKQHNKYHIQHIINYYLKFSPIFSFYPDEILNKENKYFLRYSNYIFNIKHELDKLIKKYKLFYTLYDIEMPMIRVLCNIEKEGVTCNHDKLIKLSQEYSVSIDRIKNKIYNYVNHVFNIDSYKSLGYVLFNKLNINNDMKHVHKTKKGFYSTSSDVLSKYINNHIVIKYIIEYRKLKKIKSSYIDIFVKYLQNNKIHTSLDQFSSSTGRIISTNPNLQNIPIKDDIHAKKIRKLFIPNDKDSCIVSADYSQIELRLVSHFSQDAKLINLFYNNQDIHTIIASEVLNISIDKVTKKDRYIAKIVNFGILYGISPYGLSKQINVSLNNAKVIINNYYNTYYQLKDYINKQKKIVEEKCYVTTLFGRRFYIPNVKSDNYLLKTKAMRNIINTPIQGSTAELVKLSMIRLTKIFKKNHYKSKIIINIHDELIFNVYNQELNTIKKIIKNVMENIIIISVPLKVNIGVGSNWHELYYDNL